jgi:hypothetical protein
VFGERASGFVDLGQGLLPPLVVGSGEQQPPGDRVQGQARAVRVPVEPDPGPRAVDPVDRHHCGPHDDIDPDGAAHGVADLTEVGREGAENRQAGQAAVGQAGQLGA